MGEIEIAIIINSFNRLALLQECLHALCSWLSESQFHGKCVAVIYDAGSKDGSVEWLESQTGKLGISVDFIVSLPGDDNSFAAGLNTGVQFAVRKYPTLKYLLFYETDNQILSPEPIAQAILQLNQRKGLAACGFTVRKHDRRSAGVGQPFPTLLNFTVGKKIVHLLQWEAIPYKWQTNGNGAEFSLVDVVYTSPLLVRVDAWEASGGLDATLFPFSDCDVDWARRLYKLGWSMGVIRTDDVIHDNLDALSAWSKSRAIQNHRGRLRYFKRHRPLAVIMVWPFLLMLRHFIELVSARLFVKDSLRRTQLSGQFLSLLKSSFNSYE